MSRHRSLRRPHIWWALSLVLFPSIAFAQAVTVTVDAGKTVNDLSSRPVGLNLNYLIDDDDNRAPLRPLKDALAETRGRFMRYPGGEKSDNNLWSLPPFDAPRPTLARRGPEEWPSNDPTLYDLKTNSFASDPLDFDEFMAECRAIGCEPVVVVCYDSMFKPATRDGTVPTREQLLETAREWVRYANVTKGYGVKYWEIGNESYADSRNGYTDAETYAADLATFSAEMKAVDPTIKIGANGETPAWWQTVLTKASGSIDFLVVHEYPAWKWGSYSYYENNNPLLTRKVNTAQSAINTYAPLADRARLKIAVTEMGAVDWSDGGWPHRNDMGHAIVLFDTIGQLLKRPNVLFSQLWNTRWIYYTPQTVPSVWDAVNPSNVLNPSGRVLAIWGELMGSRMVAAGSTSTAIRAYATASGPALNVFLVNKSSAFVPATIALQNVATGFTAAQKLVMSGTGPSDVQPMWRSAGTEEVTDGKLVETTLAPYSISVLKMASQPNLIANASLENGLTGWVSWGNSILAPSPVADGAKAVGTGIGRGGIGQKIRGIQPGVEYRFAGQAHIAAPGETAWLGVTFHDSSGRDLAVFNTPVTATDYARSVVSFRAPPAFRDMYVWIWKESGTSYLYADDFSLYALP